MRRPIAAVLLSVVLLLVCAAPAIAQARDPFRPPGGAVPAQGGSGQVPVTDDGDVTPPTTGGLPRTGQDVVLLVAAAFALMSAGGALRLTGRLLAT